MPNQARHPERACYNSLPNRVQFLRMYEIFEHTADLGIRVCAGSLDELFADAARGLFSVMVANLDAVQKVEEVRFQIAGNNTRNCFTTG